MEEKELKEVISKNFENGYAVYTLLFQEIKETKKLDELLKEIEDEEKNIKYICILERKRNRNTHCNIITEIKHKNLIKTECESRGIVVKENEFRKEATESVCEYLLKGENACIRSNICRQR